MFRVTCDVVPAGQHEVILVGSKASANVLCGRAIAQRLTAQSCWSRSELEEIVEGRPDIDVETLVRQGIIVPVVITPPRAVPGCLAVLTAGRARVSMRAIDLAIDATRQRSGAATPILVVENSGNPQHQHRLVALLRRDRAARARGIELAVCSAATADALVADVAKSDPSLTDVVRFALGTGPGRRGCIGAGRNLILLLTLGHNLLSLDDDVHGPVLRRSGEGLAFESSSDRLETRPETSSQDNSWSPGDLVDAHFSWLGTGLNDSGERIGVTASGLRGDCGADAPWHELAVAARNATRPDLTRRVVRGVPRPTVLPLDGLMTYAYGCVNDGTLPPFMPAGRNEDGAFAAVLHAWKPDLLVCHVPTYVEHTPPRCRSERTYRDVAGAACRSWRTNDVIALIAARRPVHCHGGRDAVVARLSDMAAALLRGDTTSLRDLHMRYLAVRATAAAPAVDAGGWLSRRRFAAALSRLSAIPAQQLLPVEWLDQPVEAFARYLQSCATLLSRWSEVVSLVQPRSRWRASWSQLGEADGVFHVNT